jgi:hypothetical protein
MSTPREKAVFCEALEITDPEQRRQFLDQACGADKALREERLLALSQSAGETFRFLIGTRSPETRLITRNLSRSQNGAHAKERAHYRAWHARSISFQQPAARAAGLTYGRARTDRTDVWSASRPANEATKRFLLLLMFAVFILEPSYELLLYFTPSVQGHVLSAAVTRRRIFAGSRGKTGVCSLSALAVCGWFSVLSVVIASILLDHVVLSGAAACLRRNSGGRLSRTLSDHPGSRIPFPEKCKRTNSDS